MAELPALYPQSQGVVSAEGDAETRSKPKLTPIDFQQYDFVPGARAPWRCSPEACYGPDELGYLRGAIDDLIAHADRADDAARIWEVLQAWEQRLFRRNYHFLNVGRKGWGMFGGSSGTTGASILQSQNSMKLFSVNVYGARHKKIVALLSREVPPVEVTAADDESPMDSAAAQEAVPYLKAFREQAQLRKRIADAAGYLYTDGQAVFLTYTVADQARYGTELDEHGEPVPGRREEVEVFGKLERKFPIMADNLSDMGWVRVSRERNINQLQARYPWIRERISGGANMDAMGQLDRMARANVRLAVQASSTSGEAYNQDTTESVFFFRPEQYEGIHDPDTREIFYENFPDGLEVWTAGGEIALVRNGRMDGPLGHVSEAQASPGDGQNRESIGTNLMPIQKVMNATISLQDRYIRGGVARRYAGEPVIDVEALNFQSNDPAKITPFDLTYCIEKGIDPASATFVEQVVPPNETILTYIQWLISGLPQEMDGGTPAVFGQDADGVSKGTFGEARLDRDQALQVFSLPWQALAAATADISAQAIHSAAENRISDFTVGLQGERVRVRVSKLQGEVLVWSTSTEIPPTLAEQQAEIGQMLQSMGQVPFYSQVLNDPRNLEIIRRMPSLSGLHIPGMDDLEAQMADNQKLLSESPLPNPQVEMLKEQLMQADMQLAQAQQMGDVQTINALAPQIQQMSQQIQSLPPLISTCPVPQDASQNHSIRAAVALAALNSAKGRAAQEGNQQQKAGWLNLKLNWEEHTQMAQKLMPPPAVEMRANMTLDPTKLPPDAQAIAFEKLGIQMPPFVLQPQEQTHEITQESEGLDPESGVPVKRKVSVVGKPLN
jgi:hypothetical protein